MSAGAERRNELSIGRDQGRTNDSQDAVAPLEAKIDGLTMATVESRPRRGFGLRGHDEASWQKSR
jgi:hypothetical protein